MRRSSLAAVVAAALAALASAPTASAQDVLTASCEPPHTAVIPDPLSAQDFTAQQSGNLSRAQVSLRRDPTTAPVLVEIRTVDSAGNPTNVVLASGFVPAANVGSTPDLEDAVLTPPTPIVAGQRYAIVVMLPDNYAMGIKESSNCPGMYRFFDFGMWNAESSRDRVFRVFVSSSSCRGRRATHVGTDGKDTIFGTPGRDVIAALGGADRVFGLGGRDLICLGVGRDKGNGGAGKDKLFGQAGKDTLKGGVARDLLSGGGGMDICKGGAANDLARCEVEKSAA